MILKPTAKTPSVLAAATRKPFTLPSRLQPSTAAKSGNIQNPSSNSKNNIPGLYQRNPDKTTKTDSSHSKPAEPQKRSISFAPSFVPTAKSKKDIMMDSLVEDTNDDFGDRVLFRGQNVTDRTTVTDSVGLQSQSPQPAMKRRRTRIAAGKWGKRLIAIRNARNSYAFRLQHQGFARTSSFDINNPRKRAKSRMDVTIMGHYDGPWMNLPEEFPITVLGYVHNLIEHQDQNPDNKGNRNEKGPKGKIVREGIFAWFTFKLCTARIIGLERGCRLKIYNSVIMPCRQVIDVDLPESLSGLYLERDSRCRDIVICTDMSERIN
jgi:hypothetical protein